MFIVYKLDMRSRNLDTEFALNDCLFGDVKLTWNFDPEKYRCSG